MVSRFGKSRKISKPYCAKRAKILRNDPRFIDFSAAGENFEVFLLKFDDFPLKFIKLRAAGAKKNENLKTLFSTFNEIWKISKPSFQDSENFENPQNPPCEIWNSIFQNLKNLILWSPEATLKGLTPRGVSGQKKKRAFFFVDQNFPSFFLSIDFFGKLI